MLGTFGSSPIFHNYSWSQKLQRTSIIFSNWKMTNIIRKFLVKRSILLKLVIDIDESRTFLGDGPSPLEILKFKKFDI